jgi:hypothetical protein
MPKITTIANAKILRDILIALLPCQSGRFSFQILG